MGFLLEFGLCITGLLGSQYQAWVVISQSEGTGKSGLVGIPGGKVLSIFPYHSLRSVWQCGEQPTMERSSSDKQGCKIHSQGMRAGEALPGTAATCTPRPGWEPRRHAETRSLSNEWQWYSCLILKWKVIASGLKNKGKPRSALAELRKKTTTEKTCCRLGSKTHFVFENVRKWIFSINII